MFLFAGVGVLVLGLPTGSWASGAGQDSELAPDRIENGDQLAWNPDWILAEASFTAPVGTLFEFSVDWLDGSAALAPISEVVGELADPDAGCAVTRFGWLVEPPGVRALGDCAEKRFFEWPVARSSLTCVVTSGYCAMVMETTGNLIGHFILDCYDGPGTVLVVWSQQSFRTMNCRAGGLGHSPDRWDVWSGRVGSFPNVATDQAFASGLNWRFEP